MSEYSELGHRHRILYTKFDIRFCKDAHDLFRYDRTDIFEALH